MSSSSPPDNAAVENANAWAGQPVNIRGQVGGWMRLEGDAGHNSIVSTDYAYRNRTCFLVKAVPEMPGVVTFQVEGTDLYLTNIMYGDQHRQDMAAALASIPGILADNIGMIVDYAVGRPTNDTNFEGAGYNYSPMVTQRGPPNKLQMFRLERRGRNGLGVRSLFGTYWRSQHWNHTVSQSPHLLGDETWSFNRVNPGEGNDDAAALSSDSRSDPDLMASCRRHVALQAMQERFPGASSHDLVRFLKARNFDESKAIAMYDAHLQWRQKTFPIPNEGAVQKLLATRKFYMLDELDGAGRPIVLYCLHRFKDAPYDMDNELQALVYLLEHQVLPRFGLSFETQKMTVLIDVSGIRSPPLAFLQKLNSVMEANYPETLYRSIMFPVPFWLQKIIQGCLTFVAENTREKFAYVNDIKSLEDFAVLPWENMGPDIAELVQTNQLIRSNH